MDTKQALEVIAQVQIKFVASGQDHRLLSEAIKTLAEAVHPTQTESSD
ncbi:MAG: hypothetical protein Unbinned1322contig1001_33 [Prokaryotic dsDNA virus sp.]|nr:MAG: hypothetical protein Unbinned1322contig1001_33 [Prokaryotic dsDNA virus sp.]|tara:strand:- start:31699 stop:31842 length:144 start_codon:yes stop_codon:yes gene_type:complete